MLLMRYVGTVLRNKGVKDIHQIKDPRKFYQLWWEYDKSKSVKLLTDEEWKRLDKKYSRPARN